MTEHSICQPGRPSPQGDCQAGSPGLDLAFHSAKSAAWRLPELPVREPRRVLYQLYMPLFLSYTVYAKVELKMS